MTNRDLPGDIEVYEIGARRLYVKTGVRNFAISEVDVTPEELVGIAKDIAARQARPPEPQIEQAFVQVAVERGNGGPFGAVESHPPGVSGANQNQA
jgi:hypothetical protein